MKKTIPINKGNYSLDTPGREKLFEKNRGFGVRKEYKKNRKDWEEFPKKFHVSYYPLLVDVELASICNLTCHFCYTILDEWKLKVNAKLMEWALFTKIIDEIAGKVFAIRLSFRGEATLHSKFVDAIKYAKDKGIKEVSFLTHGGSLSPRNFEKIMKAGADWITISFDGMGEEYEKNRYPLKYDKMYERFKQMKEIKKRHNSVKPVIKIQTIWPAIQNCATEFYNEMSKVSDLVAFNPLIDFTHSTPYEEIEFVKDFACPQPYQRLVIGADGTAMMCANDEENDHIIGDANKETIYEIWHGEKLNKVRELHKQKDGFKKLGPCRKCYIPRATNDDKVQVNGREVYIRNYK